MKKGWDYKKFSDVFPIKMGKTPPRADKSNWDENKVTSNKWVSIADISSNEGKVIFDTKEYISNSAAAKIYKVSEGSLLMSFKLSIGRMAFAGTDLYTNEAIIAIPKNDLYILKFLYYYISSYDWTPLTEGADKVKGKTLNKESIGKIKLPIVSSSEQEEIVCYLDSAFEKIDELKKNAEQQLTESKALFQKALTEYLSPKKDWEEKKLKEIGKTQTGTTPSKNNKEYYGSEIPFIRPSEIDIDGRGGLCYDTELKLSKEGAEKGRIFESGSILMVCIGATLSKTGISDKLVSCNQQINVLTPNEGICGRFVYFSLISPTFKGLVIKEGNSAQATLPIINKGKWENLTIPLPPLSEQQAIVAKLDTISAHCRQLENNYRQTITLCDDLKQKILKQIFES